MQEEYSQGDEWLGLEGMLPEARLREIARMKQDAQAGLQRIGSDPERAGDREALERTLLVLDAYEADAQNELHALN